MNDANDNGKADLGETLTYEFVVSNDGTGAVLDVVVTDPKLEGAGLKFVEGPQTLEPGASFTFTVDGEYTVTEEDVVAGEVKNTATAKGSNVPSVDDSENTPTPEAKAELVIDKIAQLDDANGNGKADSGEQITWYFNVTNNGNVAVKDVQVVDEFLKGEGITPVLTDQAAPEEAEGETPEEFVAGTQVVLEADQIGQATFNGMLKPGQSLTFVADKMYSVDAADAVEGEIVNVAEPTGTPEGDVPMSTNEDDTHNPMPDAPKDTPAAPGTPAAGAKPAQPKGDLATTGADAGLLAVGGLSALLLAASGVMLLRRKNAASDEI